MNEKVAIIAKGKSLVAESIIYKLNQEKVDYVLFNRVEKVVLEEVSIIVFINDLDFNTVKEKFLRSKLPVVYISKDREIIKDYKGIINYVVTDLIDDKNSYSYMQKEFLYRKDKYNFINNIIYDFIKDKDYSNNLIIDTTHCQSRYHDWTFDFDTINESYEWLSKKNKMQNFNIEEKTIDFFLDRIYNDSDKEIKYLIDKVSLIKKNKKSVDMFICTKEELIKIKSNHYFKVLVKHISNSYKIYIVDKDILREKDPEIYNKIVYGVLIYDDCVYRDYYNNEYSLGYVDCKPETIKEYNQIYDEIIKKYGTKIKAESDFYEF